MSVEVMIGVVGIVVTIISIIVTVISIIQNAKDKHALNDLILLSIPLTVNLESFHL